MPFQESCPGIAGWVVTSTVISKVAKLGNRYCRADIAWLVLVLHSDTLSAAEPLVATGTAR